VTRLAVLLLLCCLGARAFAAETIVWVTVGDYPPFVTSLGSDDPAGLDRDIANAICRELARPCHFVATTWDDMAAGLIDGRYDVGFSGLTVATVAAAGLQPSQPYFSSGGRFVVLDTGAPVVDAFSGSDAVGVLAGTPHAAYLERELPDPSRLRRFPDDEELYLSLLGGAVGAAFGDALTLYEALIAHPGNLPVVFAGPSIEDPTYFDADVVFALAEGNPLADLVDGALSSLRDSGELARIVQARLPGYASATELRP